MPMQVTTLTANGITVIEPELRHDRDVWVAVGVTAASSLGGGTLDLGYTLDNGATFHPLEGLTGLSPGACRPVQWPAPLAVRLAGATSPSVVVHHMPCRAS